MRRILAAIPATALLTLWFTTDLQKAPCESQVAEQLPEVVDHFWCHDKFQPVSTGTASEQISYLIGRASGAGKDKSWGMLSEESQRDYPKEKWLERWDAALFAERVGPVQHLPGFNNYSVRYRVYGPPDPSGPELVEYEQHFQIRSLGNAQYSIRLFDNLEQPEAFDVDYVRAKVLANTQERNSPVDGTIIGKAREGLQVWLYCAIDIPGHGSWVRSSVGFMEAASTSVGEADRASIQACDSHYAADVLTREGGDNS